ncbi:GtrA family protein [Weissella kandleri]|uniref:GtrA family protein n=1 Tax=Weissella kandleri TaxID=1616 RepID=UPI00387E40DA
MTKVEQLLIKYREQIIYLVFGVLTTLVSIIVYGALHLMAWPYQLAYWSAWFLSVLFAYLTNRHWVFRSQAQGFLAILRETFNFYLARLLTGLLGSAIMGLGVGVLHQNDFIWNIIQNIFVIIANYALSKWFIFKGKE